MKSILTVSVFILLLTGFAQKDSISKLPREDLKLPKVAVEIDSVSIQIQKINERYESILEKDEIIDKKIAEIIKKGSQINSELSAKNQKLTHRIKVKEKESELKVEKIDSLNSVIEKYESSLVLVDSICVRWSFLAKRLNENCREWKIVILK